MEEQRYLTFALGKGRLAKQTLATFEKIGITCEEMKDPGTRKLIFVNEDLKLRGPGEFFGVKQSGTMNFALGDIYSNADILKMASEAVDYLKKEGYNFQKLHQYSLEKNLNFAKNI